DNWINQSYSPSAKHEVITGNFTLLVDRLLRAMNIETITDYDWMRTTHYKASATKGKQPDDALVPYSRCGPGNINQYGWPTLVIKTGLAETLPQLRNDARHWLEMSNASTCRGPSPFNRTIHHITDPTSSQYTLIQQTPTSQHPYCAQEVTITQDIVEGAPIIFPFEALHDRLTVAPETDIVFTAYYCLDMTHRYWWLPR
ncbi:hypothetical protein N7528_002336, partial [Penicillium herquei]